MACHEALRVQAYFDGELDAGAAVEIEQHVEACGECASLLQELKTGRGALRQQGLYHRASSALTSRITSALDREDGKQRWHDVLRARGREFWFGAGTGAVATAAAAAALSLLLVTTPVSSTL